MQVREVYEEFRFRADGSAEAIDRTAYTTADYIALMQHYSAATGFLDWTEDALSAMYFALEGFLDDNSEKKKANAAVYIFSPALYNFARKKIIADKAASPGSKMGIEMAVIENTLYTSIPNLTVSYNLENYFMYLLGNEEYDKCAGGIYDDSAEHYCKWKYYVPLAVYVSRLNYRLRAQSGIFLAYNIYTEPDAQDEFSHVSLERIQEKYLQEYRGHEDTCPFLYKIIIQEDAREKIAEWVKAFGMSKEKCYPELSHVGERIMK